MIEFAIFFFFFFQIAFSGNVSLAGLNGFSSQNFKQTTSGSSLFLVFFYCSLGLVFL